MTTAKDFMTKGDYAKYWGVSPGRVSQCIKIGLPVEPDGRIRVAAADRWRAETLLRARVRPVPEPRAGPAAAPAAPGRAAVLALLRASAGDVERAVCTALRALGVPLATVYAATIMVAVLHQNALEKRAARVGLLPEGAWLGPCDGVAAEEWEEHARQEGNAVDFDPAGDLADELLARLDLTLDNNRE
jgi:hypothetical protein